jgi:hypothetical protein
VQLRLRPRGGGTEFMRPWTEVVYGVPPDQVVGSRINAHIGVRPVAAFGNSDGDLQMLQWATMWPGARFGLLVHHTDAGREYAFEP